MSFSGLMSSVGKIKRNQIQRVNGQAQLTPVYQPAPLNYVRCRLDLLFMRTGKDAPAPQEAGRAPDRIGVLFYDPSIPIKAGDIIEMISGPVTGSFEIPSIPDVIQGYATAHHIEVQVREVNQDLTGQWPAADGVDQIVQFD